MEKETSCRQEGKQAVPQLYLPFLQNIGLLLQEKADSNEFVWLALLNLFSFRYSFFFIHFLFFEFSSLTFCSLITI